MASLSPFKCGAVGMRAHVDYVEHGPRGRMAQSVEQLTHNLKVVGSNPTPATKLSR